MTTVSFVKVTLVAETPTTVTRMTLPEKNAVDLALDVDQHGRPHLPPATLAGSLRRAVSDALGVDRASELFGRIRSDEKGANHAVASPVWTLHTSIDGAPEPAITTTAVDARRGAAALSTRRTAEFLAAGTTVDFILRVDEGLEDILTALTTWRPVVGRSKSNGHGVLAVRTISYGTIDLGTSDGLRIWLNHQGTELVDQVLDSTRKPVPATTDMNAVELRLVVDEPWLSDVRKNESGSRKTYDLPRDAGSIVLRSSGQRGVLRSFVSFVLKSIDSELLCRGAGCDHDRWECRVFGHGGTQDAVGSRSQVTIHSATFTDTITEHRTRNAIDRFSGGAADRHLWVSEMVTAGRVDLRIENRRVAADDWDLFCCLLRLAVDDINDGFLRFGGSVTTGHGRFKAEVLSGDLPSAQEAIERINQVRSV